MNEENLNERQEKLLQWRDYFLLLRHGLEEEPWFSEEGVEDLDTFLQVWIEELKSDIRHINYNQSEFCRFSEVTNLGELENNYCTDDGTTERFK